MKKEDKSETKHVVVPPQIQEVANRSYVLRSDKDLATIEKNTRVLLDFLKQNLQEVLADFEVYKNDKIDLNTQENLELLQVALRVGDGFFAFISHRQQAQGSQEVTLPFSLEDYALLHSIENAIHNHNLSDLAILEVLKDKISSFSDLREVFENFRESLLRQALFENMCKKFRNADELAWLHGAIHEYGEHVIGGHLPEDLIGERLNEIHSNPELDMDFSEYSRAKSFRAHRN